jgi:hypothetical protein
MIAGQVSLPWPFGLPHRLERYAFQADRHGFESRLPLHPYSERAGYTILGLLVVPPNISAPCVSKVNFNTHDSCDIMIATNSVMDMKRSLGILSSVLLVTLGLLTVPVGFVAFAFSPIEGLVLTVIGGLVISLGIVLNGRIALPSTRHHH